MLGVMPGDAAHFDLDPGAGPGGGTESGLEGTKRTHLVPILGSRSKWAVSGTRDAKIGQIAALQRGRVARWQLLVAGLSADVIRGLVRRHQLLRVHDGVYAVGHAASVPLGAETAALLAGPEGAALSHLSAASLWGLLPPGSDQGIIDVLVGSHPRRRRPGIRFRRSRHVDPKDLWLHERLPVVSPARAVIEIADGVSARMLERAIEQGEVRGIIQPAELEEALDRFPGLAGPARVRRLLGTRSEAALTRSEAERRFLELIRQSDLPRPEANVQLHGYEVDFLWRDANVVVEIDGFQFHGTRGAFEYDRRKGARLAATGYTVLRFTWTEITQRPFAVIATVAQALVQAARGRPSGSG
jgi:very-short-patch-repair endonuclease